MVPTPLASCTNADGGGANEGIELVFNRLTKVQVFVSEPISFATRWQAALQRSVEAAN